VPRIGAARQLLPDDGDQPQSLVGLDLDAVAAEDPGVDLPQARAVDQRVGDVEGDRPDHAFRIPDLSCPFLP
jgi:hypothetical protein